MKLFEEKIDSSELNMEQKKLTINQMENKLNEIISALDYLKKFTEDTNSLVRFLLKQKLGNKSEKLIQEVQLMGRLNVKSVENLLGISKTWALKLMQKLGKVDAYRFIEGDVATKSPSYILYDKNKVLEGQMKRISELFQQSDTIPFIKIMQELAIDLEQARALAKQLTLMKDFKILDNNKLVRLNGTINS